MPEGLRFVLVGDGFSAAEVLGVLLEHEGAQVVRAYSTGGPDEPSGLTKTLEAAGIPHLQSGLLKDDSKERAQLREAEYDWLINVNSTVLLPAEVLSTPSVGGLNMHPGILPEYAGLHTHQWAIRNGEEIFGSTVHIIEPSVDAGDIVRTCRFPVQPDDTGLSLFMTCMREGTRLMGEVVSDLLAGKPLERTPQDLSARRLYRHRDALDGQIDWTQPALTVERFVRAGSYAPMRSPTYTPHVRLPEGNLEVLRVQVLKEDYEPEPPGTWILDPDCEPVVFCGDGKLIEVQEARLIDESSALDLNSLNRVLAPLDPEFEA